MSERLVLEASMRKIGQQLHFVESDVYERSVPEDHYLRRVSRALDFGFIDKMCEAKYKCVDGGPGRPAEPPQRMFRYLFLMFLYQVKFERELERLTRDSMAWRWFCGYQIDEDVASHKTLWLFRHRLGPDLFDEIFARLLEQCIACGLVSGERWHLDATKQDAAATTFSQFEVATILTRAMIDRLSSMQDAGPSEPGAPPVEMDDEMKRLVAAAASKVAKLKRVSADRVLAKAEGISHDVAESSAAGKHLPDQDKESPELEELARRLWRDHPHAKGDPDARIGKTSVKKSFCGYVSAAVVDEKHGIVLGYTTVAGNVDQADTFLPTYEKARRLAPRPRELAADRAFDILEIRRRMRDDGVRAHIPMIRTHRRGDVLDSEHFKVFNVGDGYEVRCPAGHLMRQSKSRKTGALEFRGTRCAGCPLQGKCVNAADGVRGFNFDPVLRQFQEEHWLARGTPEYQRAMKMRMATIEPVFGHAKTFHKLGKSIYRSFPMQRIQTMMSLFAVNLEKLVRYAPQPA